MSSNSIVAPDSAAAFRAAAEVAARPGREVHDIAAALCWTVRHCSKVLTGAKQGGLIGFAKRGSSACWYPATMLPAVLARDRRERRARNLKAQRERNERQRLKRLEKLVAGSPDLADAPIRRRASATAPLPFVCRAPASVFHLGGMS